MDWNADTASETGSVSVSVPTSMLERATIMSEPGSVSQCGSSWSRAEDRCNWIPPPEHRLEGPDHRPGDAQEPMDIDTDHYTASFNRRIEPSRQISIDLEREQRKHERNRRIQEIKEKMQKLSEELTALEREKKNEDDASLAQNERLLEGQKDLRYISRIPTSYEPCHPNPIQRFMQQGPREEPNVLARFNVGPRSPAPSEILDFSRSRSREAGYPEVARVGSFEVPASRKPPSPPETTIESPVQEQRSRTIGEFNSDKENTEKRPCTPPRSILKVSPPSNQESEPPSQELSKGPEPGKTGSDIPVDGNSKKPGPTKKHPCTAKKCMSSFERPCELRKHMKRHSRPFACTFRNCQKTFGSKNDWKRHENSQHHKLDEWKCDIENDTNPTSLCGKISYRKENFVNHLKSAAHSYTDKDLIDKKAEDCYLGAASGHRTKFWCGFCLDEKSRRKGTKVPVKSWDERFDHLASHFEKGLSMREFVHDDADQYSDFSSLSDYDNDEETPLAASPAILASPAKPEEELVKQTPIALAVSSTVQKSKVTTYWYCCNSMNGSACDYPGPFILENYPLCMTCGHRKCKNCAEEQRRNE